MNGADAIIIGIVLLSSLLSLNRGLFKEALSLANWAMAMCLAMSFRVQLAEKLEENIVNPTLSAISAFAIIFLFSFFTGGLMIRLASDAVRKSTLSSVDRLLGTLFGFARGMVIVMTILIIAPRFFVVENTLWWRDSQLIPVFTEFDSRALRIARRFWRSSRDVDWPG